MTDITDIIGEIAPTQGGAVSRAQLRARGASVEEVRWALQAGRLHRVARGVYTVNGSPRTRWQTMWAAHLQAGPNSVISHWTAARHYRLDEALLTPPTLTIPHRRGTPPAMLTVHRSRHLQPADIRHDRGLPVTTPARTIVDLAAECGDARLSVVLDSAHFSNAATYAEVGSALMRLGGRGRKGSRRLAQLLDARCGDPLAGSRLEYLLTDLLRVAGVPLDHAVRQHPLPSLGHTTGTVDLYLPSVGLIIEADGRRWHQRQSDMTRDRERDFAAAQVGVQTVRLMHESLTTDIAACAAGLRSTIAARNNTARNNTAITVG